MPETPEWYIERGYRRISHKYLTVSRVDKRNWMETIKKENPYILLGLDQGADHYRRCFSEDKIVLPQEIFRQIPGSGHDPCGFIDPDTLKEIKFTVSIVEEPCI